MSFKLTVEHRLLAADLILKSCHRLYQQILLVELWVCNSGTHLPVAHSPAVQTSQPTHQQLFRYV